jgi:hypothetical protein
LDRSDLLFSTLCGADKDLLVAVFLDGMDGAANTPKGREEADLRRVV